MQASVWDEQRRHEEREGFLYSSPGGPFPQSRDGPPPAGGSQRPVDSMGRFIVGVPPIPQGMLQDPAWRALDRCAPPLRIGADGRIVQTRWVAPPLRMIFGPNQPNSVAAFGPCSGMELPV